MDSDGSILWGWERFFTELSSFLRTIDRQYMLANEQFSEYAIERLETSIVSVSGLVEHLRANSGVNHETDVVSVATHYSAMFAELLGCLWGMYNEWSVYLEHYHLNRRASSYSVPVVQANPTGRPTFLISESQLQYLRSLGFSWSQIADILGVSCTTNNI